MTGEAEGTEPIAIVGVGLRFPGGCESADDFDELLREGRSGIAPLPEDRWEAEAFRPETPDEKGKIHTAGGGFLDRIDLFDAPFFNISPKEAQYVDPQQRLVLETAWHALEHADIDPTPLRRGNGGVYIGASSIDYALEMGALPYDALDGHLASGITLFPLSGRLSYFLGWRGPSVSVDTACSSSLSALHMAVQGLRLGECDIALCGGVNVLHHPSIMVMFSHGQMLARDGQCKTFDEDADGYVRAEGCGMLVLKRYADARRDGDRVLALVRGTAIGQDGDSAGLTVPHGPAQERVIRRALAAAALTPADIQYVEAHGTGTPIGDPIELGAINDVFAESHTKDAPLLVGSAKTNLGHMEPASGIVGVIKTVLQMRSGSVYPHLNLRTPSTRIPWDTYPIRVPTECVAWPPGTRRAVVNSFGFAGTIAATVLEEAPRPEQAEPAPDDSGPAVFTLSAKSRAGLRRQAERYLDFLDGRDDGAGIRSLCRTAATGRAHFGHRLADVVEDLASVRRVLTAHLADDTRPTTAPRKTAFLFSGQGAQYAGMAADLYRGQPVFRDLVDTCDELFARHLDRSVRALLTQETDADDIHRTQYTQPALFTLEYALARLWISWGIKPNVVMGHSIGEVAAATVAGLFTLPDAVSLVAARARLMQSVRAPGAMAAVSRAVEEIEPMLAQRPGLAVAAVNAPGQCVISGDAAELEHLTADLAARGIRAERLSVSHAFHSPLMAEVFEDFRAAMADITFQQPSVPIVSNLTGRVATYAEIATADYWVRHIGEPVRFMAGVRAVEKRGRHTFLEIGPSAALTALARQSVHGDGHHWVASQRRRDGGEKALLRALADLYAVGAPVDWAGVYAGQQAAARVQLPGHAFERKRYWLPLAGPARDSRGPAVHPLLGQETTPDTETAAGTAQPTVAREWSALREFTARYAPDASFWQSAGPGHDDTATLSPAAYPELLLALQDAVYGHTHAAVRDLVLHAPLRPDGDGGTTVRTRLRPRPDNRAEVEVVSGPADAETLHATAVLDPSAPPLTPPEPYLPAGPVRDRVAGVDVLTDLAAVGWDTERSGMLTEIARHEDGTLVADLTPRRAGLTEHLPVDVLECALLTAVALDDASPAFIPVGLGTLRLLKKPRGARLRVVARVTGTGAGPRTADLLILDGEAPVAVLTGVEYHPALPAQHMPSPLHRHRWLRRSAPADADPAGRRVVLLGASDEQAGELTAHAARRGLRITALDRPQELPSVLGDAPGPEGAPASPVTDLCWFWQPPAGPADLLGHARLRAECEHNFRRLLDMVAAVTGADPSRTPRLWLVTARAQWLPEDEPDGAEQPAAAMLWGFGHVLLNENPRTRTTLVDLPSADGDGLAYLTEALLTPDTGDHQLAYRDGQRHVRRLLPGRASPAWDGEFEAVALGPDGSGQPRLVPADSLPPTGDQIQVRVRAAVLARRTGTAAPATLGSGCAGTVVAAGPETRFAVGTDVVVAHHSTLRRTVTVSGEAAVPAPRPAGSTAAVASFAAYMAAHHALITRAGLTAGERVLVHGGDRAAVRAVVALAARTGAEVYVTAEPDEARTLRDLGAHDVLGLPDTAADPQASPLSGAPEADLLVGVPDEPLPAVAAGRLAAGGRTVTVAPWSDAWEPGAAERIGAALERGDLPLLPVRAYNIDELPEAGEAAETGRGGHVVVTWPGRPQGADDGPGQLRPGADAPVTVRPDRVYLVTGGLGGLGLVTARALVDLGARHLLLVSRSGTPTPEAAAILDDLAARAEVGTERADVSSPTDMARVRKRLSDGPVPLGGIVHAAGAAGKSLISRLIWEDIDAQLAAQAYGGWLLHELALDSPELDLFFVHSSIASVLGGATQAHYAAAFSFLDHLVTLRRRSGLPALSVNWGAWGAVGMSARLDENLARELERSGVRLFSPSRALRLFRQLLARPDGPYVFGWFDWNAYVAPSMVDNALYSELVDGSDRGGDDRFDLAAFLGKPEAERREAVDRVVREAVAAALQADDAEQVELTTAFVSLGMDSLMALQLKTALEKVFRVPLPATLTFDHPSPRDLADFLGGQLEAHRE